MGSPGSARPTLYYLNTEQDTHIIVFNRRITAVAEDSDGNLWAGCIEGLFSEKDQYSVNWGDRYPELRSRILGLAAGPANQLYIATSDGGLLRATVSNGAITALDTRIFQGRQGPGVVQSILSQPDGTVWLSTHHGVFHLSPGGEIRTFDTNEGLLDNDVNTAALCGDTLWVGTRSGLCFLPLKLPEVRPDFKTCMVGLHYSLGSTVVHHDLYGKDQNDLAFEIPPDANSIEIEMAGLYYRNVGSNRFIVRLEHELLPLHLWTTSNIIDWLSELGREGDHVVVSRNGLFNFGANLPPGKYRLSGYAVAADSTVSRQSAQIVLLFPPHWYQSLWLWTAIIISLAYLAWRSVQTRWKVRELDHQVSSLQLKALQAQINPHFIGNSIHAFQQFFYPPDPIRASDYVSMFTELLRQTLHFSETTFIRLQDEIAYDRRYLELILLRLGDRFQYTILGADALAPGIPFPAMLLQPILENATQHGLAMEGISILTIQFEEHAGRLRCCVRDNGMGIEASLRNKAQHDNQHISSGIRMLEQKIATLNQLYPADIRMRITDRIHEDPPAQGTQVEFSMRILPDSIAFPLQNSNPKKNESLHH